LLGLEQPIMNIQFLFLFDHFQLRKILTNLSYCKSTISSNLKFLSAKNIHDQFFKLYQIKNKSKKTFLESSVVDFSPLTGKSNENVTPVAETALAVLMIKK